MATQQFDKQAPSTFDATPALGNDKLGGTVQATQTAEGLHVGVRTDQDVAGRLKSALLYIWRGRGLFGGLFAIGLAFLGQQALLERNDYQTSTRNYILAIIILIISLTNPSLDLVRRVASRRAKSDSSPLIIDSEANSVISVDALADDIAPVKQVDSTLVVTPQETVVLPMQSLETAPAISTITTVPTRKVRTESQPSGAADTIPSVAVMPLPQERIVAPLSVVGTDPSNLWQRWVVLRSRLGWRFTAPGLAVTAGLAIWSALVLLQDYTLPLGGWLWAGSLFALLLTFLGASGWPRGEGLLPTPMSDFFARGVPVIALKWEAILAAGMMLLAIFLRLNNLEYHPGIFGDEGEQGMNVRAIVEGRLGEGAPVTGQTAPLFGSGWWQVPNLSFYVWSFSLRIFGDSMFGLRMFSAISGIVAVWFIYRIARLLWGSRAGLIAGTMLAVSPLALQFSKFANVSSATSALWAVGFFYFFMALRYRKWTDWLLAGFFWSLNLYFYPAGKLIIPLIGVAGLYCLVRWRLEFFKRYLLGFVLLGATFALTFMPYYIFSAKFDNPHWYGFAGRAGETSIFSPQNQGPTFARYNIPYDPSWAAHSTVENIRNNPAPWIQLVYQQSRETVDSLFRRGDDVYYYRLGEQNTPVFSPLWAVLALLGLAYAVWKFWDPRFGLVFLWFGFGLAASILTVDTPNLQRFTGAWPVAMIFPAVLIDRIFAAGWPLRRGIARKWATVPIAALLAFLAFISYQEYFVAYATSCPYCRDTVQARFAQSLGQDYKAYQLGTGNGYDVYFNYGSTRFVAKGVEGREMLTPADTLPIIDNGGKGAAFIVYPHNYDYLPILRLMYPGGLEKEQKAQDGVTYLTTYQLTREQVTQSQMVHVTYTTEGANKQTVTRDEPRLGNVEVRTTLRTVEALPPVFAGVRKFATWKGGLVAPAYGTYTLALDGTATGATLVLDGRTLLTLPVLDTNSPNDTRQIDMVLAKGLHEVTLSGTVDDSSKFQLLWSSGGSLSPIESQFLYNGPTGGLSGEIGPVPAGDAIKAADPFSGVQPAQRRSDTIIGFRQASDLFGQASYLGRWQGTLNVPAEGDYGFSVSSVGPALVLLDGQAVVGDGPNGAGTGLVHLSAGSHPLDVRYMGSGVPSRLELFWLPPGGGQPVLIPPTVLTPEKRSWLQSEMPNAPVAPLPPPQTTSPADIRQPDLTFGEGLVAPKGLGVDQTGNIYVGDRGNHRVVVYSPDGKKLREWGKAAPTVPAGQTAPAHEGGEFADISDLAVTQDGTVYVFDSTPRVQAFKQTGEYIGSFEPDQLGLYGPNGIADDRASGSSLANGSSRQGLFIAVTGQNRVLRLPSIEDVLEGKAKLPANTESASGSEGDTLEQPVDAVSDPSGSGLLYEADLNRNSDRIAQLEPVGATSGQARQWKIKAQWRVPIGKDDGGSRLAMSPDGKTVYMSDPDRKRVTMLNVDTGEITSFGAEGSDPGKFGKPTGIAVSNDGKIYVLDGVNNNVQVFSSSK